MPKLLDHHATLPQLPPEAIQQMSEKLKAGQVDEFGVKGLNVFIGGGQGWCLTEASDADAVCQSHAAIGFPLDKGDVTEIISLV